MNADDEWIEAPPVPEAFVMSIGDMLDAMTNGRLIATPRRVRTTGGQRLSALLSALLDEGEVPAPASYVAGDHLAIKVMRRLDIRGIW